MHQNKHQNNYKQHVPVLMTQVLQCLDPKEGDSYLDLTAGYGGHAEAVLAITKNFKDSVLVDRDNHAIEVLEEKFADTSVGLKWQDFLTASQELVATGQQFDLILADLGVSSPHLNEANRGFSIKESSELDMRMDQRQALSAHTIVNTYSEAELASILKTYGEEPKAKQIAREIVAARPVDTTDQLAAIAVAAWPGHSRVHPATRTFQALRISVNDELGLLEKALPLWEQLLAPGGRIAIISFHSLEDRITKRFLKEVAGDRYDAELRLLTKSPLTAAENELVLNPRARSAKLRAAVKIKNRKGSHAYPGQK